MAMSDIKEETTSQKVVDVAILWMLVSTSVALLDGSIHLYFTDQTASDSATMFWKQLSVTILFYGALYLVLLVVVGALAMLLLRRWPAEINQGVAVFIASFAPIVLANDLLWSSTETANVGQQVLWVGFYVLLAILVVGVWVRFNSAIRRHQRTWHPGILPFATVALAEIIAYLVFERIDSLQTAPIVLGVLLVGMAVLSGVAIFMTSPGLRIGLMIALFVFLFGLAPLPLALTDVSLSTPVAGARSEDLAVGKIVLITIDTMRADLLSAANPQSGVTERIDVMADDAVVFTNARSPAPWTKPSVCSILTGLSPRVHQAVERDDRLSDRIETWAERFQAAGYQTAAFGFNHNLAAKYNIDQGFQSYTWYPTRLVPTPPLQFGLASRFIGTPYLHVVSDTKSLTSNASNWLRENKNENFFLWLHYLDPHMPYKPPLEFIPEGYPAPKGMATHFENVDEVRRGISCRLLDEQRWVKELYWAEMKHVDNEVGRLIDTLRQLAIYDDTLIVLTSDHGEEFWEHGAFEHGHTVYEELLRVPLVIKFPESERTGQIDDVVSLEDILPTVLVACKIDYDPLDFTGLSLASLWDDPENPFRRRSFHASVPLYFEPCEALLVDNLKYIRYLETDRQDIFDLQSDPMEQSPITPSPEALEMLETARRELEGTFEQLRTRYWTHTQEKTTNDSWDLEQVRTLGYL